MTVMKSPPASIADRIRSLGHRIDPIGTAKLYSEALKLQPTDGVEIIHDIAYGDSPRQVLDVYHPNSSHTPRDVVIFFHGGGYSRGDKSDRTNVGFFFARNGVIALIANYRLAPEYKWPSGAKDVLAAVHWAKTNVSEYRGNSQRIVLMGESAGAAHVAAAAFVSKLNDGKPLEVAGVVLHSGSYNVALEKKAASVFGTPSPDVRNEQYYGKDFSRYDEMSTALLIDTPDVRSLILYAEYDPVQMQVQAGELFATLARRAQTCPIIRRLNGHGHISQISSFNTEDTSVSGPVLEFVLSR